MSNRTSSARLVLDDYKLGNQPLTALAEQANAAAAHEQSDLRQGFRDDLVSERREARFEAAVAAYDQVVKSRMTALRGVIASAEADYHRAANGTSELATVARYESMTDDELKGVLKDYAGREMSERLTKPLVLDVVSRELRSRGLTNEHQQMRAYMEGSNSHKPWHNLPEVETATKELDFLKNRQPATFVVEDDGKFAAQPIRDLFVMPEYLRSKTAL